MTNTNETGEATLLKTDDLGRVRTPQARRESLLDEYERSGLSGAKFAALTGIKYSTFATWAQRRRKPQRSAPITAKPRPSVQWLEAVVDQAQSCDGQKPPINLTDVELKAYEIAALEALRLEQEKIPQAMALKSLNNLRN